MQKKHMLTYLFGRPPLGGPARPLTFEGGGGEFPLIPCPSRITTEGVSGYFEISPLSANSRSESIDSGSEGGGCPLQVGCGRGEGGGLGRGEEGIRGGGGGQGEGGGRVVGEDRGGGVGRNGCGLGTLAWAKVFRLGMSQTEFISPTSRSDMSP